LKLRNILAALSPKWREQEVCEACGQPFTCGVSLAGCWCAEVKVSEEVRAELKKKYTHCLCRTCLERAAQNSTADERR
jgi:hypothetical protein